MLSPPYKVSMPILPSEGYKCGFLHSEFPRVSSSCLRILPFVKTQLKSYLKYSRTACLTTLAVLTLPLLYLNKPYGRVKTKLNHE